MTDTNKNKRGWRCPRCNSIKPPKSYHCPDCNAAFTPGNYDLIKYDYGPSSSKGVKIEWNRPSGNMDDEDFEGRTD